jgi:hypothetical protein
MAEEKKIQEDDFPLGCMFALFIFFAIVLIICVIDYRDGELTKSGLYASTFSVIVLTALIVKIIVKIVRNISKKSGDG